MSSDGIESFCFKLNHFCLSDWLYVCSWWTGIELTNYTYYKILFVYIYIKLSKAIEWKTMPLPKMNKKLNTLNTKLEKKTTITHMHINLWHACDVMHYHGVSHRWIESSIHFVIYVAVQSILDAGARPFALFCCCCRLKSF